MFQPKRSKLFEKVAGGVRRVNPGYTTTVVSVDQGGAADDALTLRVQSDNSLLDAWIANGVWCVRAAAFRDDPSQPTKGLLPFGPPVAARSHPEAIVSALFTAWLQTAAEQR